MAFSEFPTKLSLDRFAAVLGISPFHFNQLVLPPSLLGESSRQLGCDAVIYQHRYQSPGGVPGRNDIGRAIYDAEQMIEGALGFDILRTWHEAEPIEWGHPIQLQRGYFVSAASEIRTLIEEGAVIETEDRDGDGYAESAVVTVSVDASTAAAAAGDAASFRLFHAEHEGDPLFEIRPADVTLNVDDLTVTLRCSVAQLVDPNVVEQMIPGPLDPEEPGVIVDAVDVYRVSYDTALTGAFSSGCADCTPANLHLEVSNRHRRDSLIHLWTWGGLGLGAWDLAPPCWCGAAASPSLSYTAGWPKSTLTRMDPRWERAVVALVMADLGGICSCKNVLGIGAEYSRELNVVAHSEVTGPSAIHDRWHPVDRALKNPFGVTLGAKVAWDACVNEIIVEPIGEYTPRPVPIFHHTMRG